VIPNNRQRQIQRNWGWRNVPKRCPESDKDTGLSLRQTLDQRPNSGNIIVTLFGKQLRDLTSDEYDRYKRLARDVSYYRRYERNKTQQRKDKSWQKLELLRVLGWKAECMMCGYSRYIGALHFHHIDPHQKVGVVKTVEEARKCRLLCANCHHEAHRDMPVKSGGRPRVAADPFLESYMRLSGLSEDVIAAALANRPQG
jgi:5-methylcytosine-specific restriction endonuclease McrA